MIYLIYNFVIILFDLGIKIKSKFRPSLKSWIKEREITNVLSQFPNAPSKRKTIWIHCASLGEYYMINPVIRALKEKSDCIIYLSFFSPSGYNNLKSLSHIDHKFYLPSDSIKNARRLIKLIKPDLYIGVKYEFWWNLLNELHRAKVPIVYTNVSLYSTPFYLKKPFSFFKNIYSEFNKVFVQNTESEGLLRESGLSNIMLSGDTRIDDVLKRKLQTKLSPNIEIENSVMVWGSVYLYECNFILDVINKTPEITHIIVPHNVESTNVNAISVKLGIESRWSEDSNDVRLKSCIVDQIGVLFDLYSLADIAYVGGGFKGKLHNVLEPIAHKVFTLFGPKHEKFPEAQDLIDYQIARVVHSGEDAVIVIKNMDTNLSPKFDNYFDAHKGASAIIEEYILDLLD